MADDNKAPHLRLTEWWEASSSGIVVDRTDPATIEALEAKYGILLPPDFRAYLAFACPQNDPSWDNELFNWWPVWRLKNLPDEQQTATCKIIQEDAESYIFFADYFIWCWAWAICCKPGKQWGKVAVIGGRDRIVADNFSDFVSRYIADPSGIDLFPE